MANLILASKREVKSGAIMWHVYRSEDSQKSAEFYFTEPLKALRYAFILRKRTGAVIPKAIYNKLMADVKASQPQQEQPTEESVGDAPAVTMSIPKFEHFMEMKAKHPDCILLMRDADNYVSFGPHADVLSEVCGIPVEHSEQKFHPDFTGFTFAKFPAHELDTWLPKLVRAGKRVAICDMP